MKLIVPSISVGLLVISSCGRTEMHHPDERRFAEQRAVLEMAIEFEDAHGRAPRDWSELEEPKQAGNHSSEIPYLLVSINKKQTPLFYSKTKDGTKVMVTFYSGSKRVQGYLSSSAFQTMESSGVLETNSISERKE